jgi:hypothetical protein
MLEYLKKQDDLISFILKYLGCSGYFFAQF